MRWGAITANNNIKIFENDIVKFKDSSHHETISYGQIVFNHDNCQFEIRNLKRNTYFDKSFGYDEHELFRIRDIEVIGNIHENPNMLIEYDEIPKETKKK